MTTSVAIQQGEGLVKPNLRDRIVAAAWEIGDTATPTVLTVRNIATRAGVSPALLYTYFESKAALLRELQRLAQPRLEAELAEVLSDTTPAEALQRICVAYIGFARRHRWLYEEREGEADASGLNAVFLARLGALLEASGRPTAACRMLLVAIDGLVDAGRMGEDAVDRTFTERYVGMLLRGV